MKLWKVINILIFFLLILAGLCNGQKGGWENKITGVGTFSSPRCLDINADGVMDIIMGAGRKEFQACDSAVIALNGITGELIWTASARDQIFGSATFLHINADSIKDVVIGGRSAELVALDGRTGTVLWRFVKSNQIRNPSEEGWYNFYNAQIIADLTGDGINELIVSNGGDVMAAPHDSNRPFGNLVVIDGQSGVLIAKAKMPDNGEIYMSILVIPDAEDTKVVFGTGGETISGNLWICSLSDILREDLSSSQKLDSSVSKGYIGPPTAVDINLDGTLDVITNSVDGRLMAFDGISMELIWQLEVPETESYSSVTIGNFDDDVYPDAFISNGRGVWPDLGWGIQKLVSGKNGEVLFTDSLGFYQITTALAYDINNDGQDEVIMSLNYQEVSEIYEKFFYTVVIAIDFKTGDFELISPIFEGSNMSSTPWIGDLDADGFLDIIFCHGTNLRHTYTFDQIKIHRIPTNVKITKPVRWGAYQGSNYNGSY